MEWASVCREDGQFLSMKGMSSIMEVIVCCRQKVQEGSYLLALIEFSMMLPSYHAALILLMYQVYPLLFESLCSLPGIQWYSDAHLLQRGAYTSDVFFTGLEIFWPPEVCGIGCKWQKKPLRWCGAPCWLVMNRSSSNCPFVSLIWLSSFRLFAF